MNAESSSGSAPRVSDGRLHWDFVDKSRQNGLPLRIVEDRNEHLSWMHDHVAAETLVARLDPEPALGPVQLRGAAHPAPLKAPAEHLKPILPY